MFCDSFRTSRLCDNHWHLMGWVGRSGAFLCLDFLNELVGLKTSNYILTNAAHLGVTLLSLSLRSLLLLSLGKKQLNRYKYKLQ